jgi:hypothetical protein
LPGGYRGGGTPVPIPNTEVKPSNADGTASLRGGRVGRRQAFLFTKEKAWRPKLFSSGMNAFEKYQKSLCPEFVEKWKK